MGPGTLSLGTDPDDLDVSCQVKAFRVECSENVKKTEPTPMLCGEDKTTADRVTREWKVTGKILQDLAAAGVVDYTWANASDTVAFLFIPSTAKGRKVTGVTRLVPISVGGDAGTDPDSDLSWAAGGAYSADDGITGDPTLTNV
jgi:hypothetical protein